MFFYKQLYRHGVLNASQQTATCCKQSNNLKAHVSTVNLQAPLERRKKKPKLDSPALLFDTIINAAMKNEKRRARST